MNIFIKIGNKERSLSEATTSWIQEKFREQAKDGKKICVWVRFDTPDIKMTLSTPGCATGGGGRPPNEHERRIFELWDQMHLNEQGFAPGNVIAFIKRLKDLIR